MELKDAMNKRRSIRKYQKKEVSDAMIETLIEAAIQAPTWKNSQTGRYHVVRSQQMLERAENRAMSWAMAGAVTIWAYRR